MSEVLNSQLFEKVLLNPSKRCDSLSIITGYATAAMAFHHLDQIKDSGVKVRLIIGMAGIDGISSADHRGFNYLTGSIPDNRFECSYIFNQPPIHSKLYIWSANEKPIESYIGSANYTQRAFGAKQREILAQCDALTAMRYYESVIGDSIYCNHIEATSLVDIFDSKKRAQRSKVYDEINEVIALNETQEEEYIGLEHVTISLLDKSGNVPEKSGLNWGQRPGRERNQAYISLKGDIRHSSFFPERGTHFTLLTDDGKVLICTRAQDDGKAIETPHNNSLIGEYFRNRLGLSNGAFVRKEDLERYGRSSIEIYKIDDETFRLDFSK